MTVGTQRCALPRYQNKEMEILNISLPLVGIEPTISRVYRYIWPIFAYLKHYKKGMQNKQNVKQYGHDK